MSWAATASRRRTAVAASGLLAAAALVVGAAPVGASSRTADPQAPVVRLADPRIVESSGLALSLRHPGVAWTHNDSGDRARLFAVDLTTGATRATVTLTGVTARDWEAVAAVRQADGTPVLWVADIGDNAASRSFVRLYRVVEPAALRDVSASATEYRLRYPDGAHNAEALLADPLTRRLWVVTKQESAAAFYQLPDPLRRAPQVNTARRVAAAPAMVTDGAYAADGTRLALVGYLGGWLLDRPGGASSVIGLPLRPQGESVTWTADGAALLVGSEGVSSGIWRVPVPATAPAASPASPAPAAPTPAYGPGENATSSDDAGNVPYRTVGALSAGGAAGLLVAVAVALRLRARRRGGG